MTVSSTLDRKTFTGDDATTAFATTPVVFFDETDLEVYVITIATGVATLQSLTTDYTVTGGAGSTGTVTMLTAPASTEKLLIKRVLPITQAVDLVNNDASDAETMEDSLDKLTMIAQQLSAGSVDGGYPLRISDAETPTDALTVLPFDRANKVLAFNASKELEVVDGTTGVGGSVALAAALAASGGSALVGTVQSGTGAIARTMQAKGRDVVSVKDFGAVGDGVTDDTAAINAAIAYCDPNGPALYIPDGTYLVTSSLTTITGQFTMYGDGPFQSRLLFVPTAADTLLELSNGASRVERVHLRDFAMYSTDTTYTKVALDVYDLSMCSFERLFIHGTGGAGVSAGACWSGNSNTSIGLRTHGREVCNWKGIEIIADRCVVIAANPNTAATDGEDCDHFHFEDFYLVGNGNPLVEVDAGLGAMELTFDGFQAWVGGTTGFKINDTRVAPTVPSRGIRFSNVRTEQGTSAAAYMFDMTFAEPVQQVTIEKTLMASGTNGIKIDGFTRVVLDQVTAAMTGTQLLVANVTAKSVLALRGCFWQSGGTFTTTGLTRIISSAFRSADYAGPSDAVYAGQITDTQVNVEQVTVTAVNTAVALKVTGTTGDQFSILPQAAGSGYVQRSLNNGGTDYEPHTLQSEQFDFRSRSGAGTVASTLTVDNTDGLKMARRHQDKQGAVLTAANNLTLGSDGNYFQVDGTTQINLILNTNWQGGSVVTLKFNSTPTVKHNQAASGNNKPILLAGAADFVASASDTLTLRYDSTDSAWYEQSRAVI